MLKKNIVLIGFMGSGKSMVAKELAKLLKREVYSTDQIIEKKERDSIAHIFETQGEAAFRRLEKEAVIRVSNSSQGIIDTGGGVILDPDNVKQLKKNGRVFYLQASPEMIYRCIQGKKNRPLLNVDDPLAKIKELLHQRAPHYEKAADYTVLSDGRTISDMTQEIYQIVKSLA